jgi:hypothetical protein
MIYETPGRSNGDWHISCSMPGQPAAHAPRQKAKRAQPHDEEHIMKVETKVTAGVGGSFYTEEFVLYWID